MSAIIMDGKALAEKLREALKSEINKLDRKPGLGVIIVGNNPASKIYVKRKQEACSKAGIFSVKVELPETATEEQVEAEIEKFNNDENIDGILVQLPLPGHLNEEKMLGLVSKDKDVDGFHLVNLGKLVSGEKRIEACTPKGVMKLLDHYKISLEGKHAVVVGRSRIVGKPVSLLLLEKNATVTMCHSKTINLKEYTTKADILIMAVGKPHLIKKEMVKHNAVVIDVGMNRMGEGVVGDVDFEGVSQVASYITPVPGGVGPMTIAMLLENCMELYKIHEGNK